jgi:TM2 domain-containing membrane protein YozV
MNDLIPAPARPIARREPRNLLLAYVLLAAGLFTPLAGMHRLYLGRIGSGILWLITWGFCGIGTLVDLFMLPRMVDDTNRGANVW